MREQRNNYGHGDLLSSLHFVTAVFFLLRSFQRTLPRTKPDETAAERRLISNYSEMRWRSNGSAPTNCESFLHLIFDRVGGGRGSICADAIFRSELTERAGTRRVTAIRALRMQKDQLWVGHTIHLSDSARPASERPPCCHKESQRRICNRIWLHGNRWGGRGIRFAFPRPLRHRRH